MSVMPLSTLAPTACNYSQGHGRADLQFCATTPQSRPKAPHEFSTQALVCVIFYTRYQGLGAPASLVSVIFYIKYQG